MMFIEIEGLILDMVDISAIAETQDGKEAIIYFKSGNKIRVGEEQKNKIQNAVRGAKIGQTSLCRDYRTKEEQA